MNPFLKNCRTGFHQDILNRTAHYCKLLSSQPTIRNNNSNEHAYILKQKNRKPELERIKNNDQLMKSLINIDRKTSRRHSVQECQFVRKKSLKNQYLQKQKNNAISSQNIRIYKKIVCPSTDFSQDKIKQFDQKITKYSKIIKHPFRSVYEMDQDFYRTYKLQLYRTRLSPCKSPGCSQSNRSFNLKKLKSKKNKKHTKAFKYIIIHQNQTGQGQQTETRRNQ